MNVVWATEQADYFDYAGPCVPGDMVLDEVVPPRRGWSAVVHAGDVLTIVDVGGNQSGDFLVYDAADTAERYSAPDTLAAQGNAYLSTGSVL
ncbi:MAG: urea carboxylase-associated family protein, partial [Actinobacteria bacterium]|nr:urea carboxylase-associated family protein [Actinomycetota bacterium]MCG2802470.1 urea carboxylase-associated family protein [Cellulomonas sp.]